MKHFRQVIDHSTLPKSSQRLAIGVLGRAIRGKELALIEALYVSLESQMRYLHPPDWVQGPRRFSKWFRGVLNTLWKDMALRKRVPEGNEQHDVSKISEIVKTGSRNQTQSQRRFTSDQWKNLDVNERQWQLVSREKERISVRRNRHVGRNETFEDEYRKWALEQLEERKYRKLLAERARQRLREARRSETS